MDWEYERNQGVHILLSFIQLSLNKLWDPPVAEEEFIGCVSLLLIGLMNYCIHCVYGFLFTMAFGVNICMSILENYI